MSQQQIESIAIALAMFAMVAIAAEAIAKATVFLVDAAIALTVVVDWELATRCAVQSILVPLRDSSPVGVVVWMLSLLSMHYLVAHL